eukprot:CAMPEP_0183520844 /NCGR_PEP_ID=MMETSP0371-20130417/17236_1 /TAXON_ID=268820 /ORGANISM="Peridinium aciculiferum, Strain PAER-2" /LENGTH=50 /DNA_ID=CAMNT_0025719281 /DNA_START=18 /DNA_END=167 /DNA_ORIENTATION=-
MPPRGVIAFAFAAALLQASLVAAGGRTQAMRQVDSVDELHWSQEEELLAH